MELEEIEEKKEREEGRKKVAKKKNKYNLFFRLSPFKCKVICAKYHLIRHVAKIKWIKVCLY